MKISRVKTQEQVDISPKTTDIVVDDQTDEFAEFEGRNTTEPGVTNDLLESLIYTGRIVKSVEVNGLVFELSTLSNKEHFDIVVRMHGFTDNPVQIYTAKCLFLSHAIKKIDGNDFSDIAVPGVFKDIVDKKLFIIDEMQYSVVDALYNEYSKLAQTKLDFGEKKGEEIKNS